MWKTLNEMLHPGTSFQCSIHLGTDFLQLDPISPGFPLINLHQTSLGSTFFIKLLPVSILFWLLGKYFTNLTVCAFTLWHIKKQHPEPVLIYTLCVHPFSDFSKASLIFLLRLRCLTIRVHWVKSVNEGTQFGGAEDCRRCMPMETWLWLWMHFNITLPPSHMSHLQ